VAGNRAVDACPPICGELTGQPRRTERAAGTNRRSPGPNYHLHSPFSHASRISHSSASTDIVHWSSNILKSVPHLAAPQIGWMTSWLLDSGSPLECRLPTLVCPMTSNGCGTAMSCVHLKGAEAQSTSAPTILQTKRTISPPQDTAATKRRNVDHRMDQKNMRLRLTHLSAALHILLFDPKVSLMMVCKFGLENVLRCSKMRPRQYQFLGLRVSYYRQE
jgi:hypothetical protein